MRFSLRRRVDRLSYDEIDREIEEQQAKAKQLVHELDEVIDLQAQLYQSFKEERGHDHSTSDE